jgi:hypothetical protein
MSEDYHHPAHVKLAEDLLADLDGEGLAMKANALTGGCMRGEDALKVGRMVILAALHAPGTEILVAGFAACVNGPQLDFYMHGEVASRDIPQDGEEGL